MSKELKLWPVESSNLDAIGWQDGVLTVVFRSGHAYQYTGVDRSVYRGLLRASSKGKYFWKHIRGQYEFCRMERDEEEGE